MSQAVVCSGHDEFPDRVEHPRQCGSFCCTDSAKRFQSFHGRLMEAMGRFAKRVSPVGKAAKAVLADVVFVVDIFSDSIAGDPLAPPTSVAFFQLSAAAGRHHRRPDNQMYLELKPIAGSQVFGTELQ